MRFTHRYQDLYNFEVLPDDVDELPTKAHNRALYWVVNQWGEKHDLDEVTARTYKEKDPEHVFSWEDVRYIYDEDKELGRLSAVNLLRGRYEFLTPEDTEDLHVYDEDRGYFDPTGENTVGWVLDRNLGSHYSQHEKREIIGRLKEEKVERDDLEAATFDDHYVCVENGVLNIDERELLEHDPKYKFTTYLPVEYNPDADCSRVRQFLDEITRREADRETLLELLGNTLLPNYNYEKVLILFGEGSNGKSTWFEVMRQFLGADNTESIDLQTIAENRFASAQLMGKFANLGEDLPAKKLDDLGSIKDLSGGGETFIEQKGKDGFSFRNRAKLMFAANRPPVLGERSKAVKRRLVPIYLPYQFTEKNDEHKDAQKEGLVEELTTEGELSGLLNAALDGLERLRDQGDVSLPEDQDERLEYYERFSDHIKAFRIDCLTNESGERVKKSTAYNAYTNFCNENDHEPVTRSTFWRQLRRTTLDVSIVREAENGHGDRPRMMDNVTFSDYGEQFISDVTTDSSGDDDSQTEEGGPTSVNDLAAGEIATVTAELTQLYINNKDWYAEEGWLVDGSGAVKLIVRDEIDLELEQGQAYRFERVSVQSDGDVLAVELIPNLTAIEEIDPGEGTTLEDGAGWLDDGAAQPEAAPDGGETQTMQEETESVEPSTSKETNRSDQPPDEDAPDRKQPAFAAEKAVEYLDSIAALRKPETTIMAELGKRYDIPPSTAEAGLEKACERGDMRRFESEDGDDEFQVV